MAESNVSHSTGEQTHLFKAETRQLLDILIHSLYTEREIFLRELISNASDALTRMHYLSLTEREILNPELELAIYILPDPDNRLLRICDTGIGMTANEMVENLGTIAHSGARAFIQAMREQNLNPGEIIGQFGVGFYSAFMVAERIEVVSRSYKPDSQAARWASTGQDSFTITPAEKEERGTEVILYLKEDTTEFTQETRLREIIKKHSDYIPFPIYLGKDKQQVNRQEALWRQPPHQVKEEEYRDFYQQFALDFQPPLFHLHLSIDAPVQLYALLYIPASPERSLLSLRREEGLKLYARKVLIQEYNRDLLPPCFRFIDGVVDSEDLSLNVSRESVQANRIMAQLRRILTGKLIDGLKTWAREHPNDYAKFWQRYGRFIREGIATDDEIGESLIPLLRYPSLHHPEELISLDDYILHMPALQTKIYYLLGDSLAALLNSPHLEMFRHHRYDVLLMSDPLDPFVMLKVKKYQNFELTNATNENLPLPESREEEIAESSLPLSKEEQQTMLHRFSTVLGDKVADVRLTTSLHESPARLINPQDAPPQEVQRIYRMLQSDYHPPKPILEVNGQHPLIQRLARLPEDDPRVSLVVEQIFENALLLEGLHPNPAEMVKRLQQLLLIALQNPNQ